MSMVEVCSGATDYTKELNVLGTLQLDHEVSILKLLSDLWRGRRRSTKILCFRNVVSQLLAPNFQLPVAIAKSFQCSRSCITRVFCSLWHLRLQHTEVNLLLQSKRLAHSRPPADVRAALEPASRNSSQPSTRSGRYSIAMGPVALPS